MLNRGAKQIESKKIFGITIFLVILGTLQSSQAQNINNDNQLWLDYIPSYDLSNKVFLKGELGARGIISNYDWNQFYLRPALTYRPVYALEFSVALGYFKTINEDDPDLQEYRIHEQLKISWPDLAVLKLFYRVRLEQRFFQYSSDFDDDYNNRLRLLIGMESMDFTWFGHQVPIYFTGAVEGFNLLFMEATTEKFINQVRVDVSFGQRIGPNLHYELHYISQRSTLFRNNGDDAYQNIFRLRFFHRIQGKKIDI